MSYDTPFNHLHFENNTISIESEIPIANFSEELMGWIFDPLTEARVRPAADYVSSASQTTAVALGTLVEFKL